MSTSHTVYLTLDQIVAKHARGEQLTAWERSCYRLNYRDDGTRYSDDPDERARQYDADNARSQRATR